MDWQQILNAITALARSAFSLINPLLVIGYDFLKALPDFVTTIWGWMKEVSSRAQQRDEEEDMGANFWRFMTVFLAIFGAAVYFTGIYDPQLVANQQALKRVVVDSERIDLLSEHEAAKIMGINIELAKVEAELEEVKTQLVIARKNNLKETNALLIQKRLTAKTAREMLEGQLEEALRPTREDIEQNEKQISALKTQLNALATKVNGG